MTSERGGHEVVLSYSGEVYNHHELRAELRQLGHEFRTRSDTKVVRAIPTTNADISTADTSSLARTPAPATRSTPSRISTAAGPPRGVQIGDLRCARRDPHPAQDKSSPRESPGAGHWFPRIAISQ